MGRRNTHKLASRRLFSLPAGQEKSFVGVCVKTLIKRVSTSEGRCGSGDINCCRLGGNNQCRLTRQKGGPLEKPTVRTQWKLHCLLLHLLPLLALCQDAALHVNVGTRGARCRMRAKGGQVCRLCLFFSFFFYTFSSCAWIHVCRQKVTTGCSFRPLLRQTKKEGCPLACTLWE